jgi:outer membrane biosynthesis protein TonB
MVVGFRKAVFWACFALAAGAAPAFAQENLDAGKSAAQLFNSDCAICHKSPQGLAKGGGMFGLSGFLREHYTASRETAALLAAYLKQVDAAPASKPAPVRRAKASKPKTDEKKADEGKKKADEAKEKTGDAKPADKPADAAPKDEKPAAAQPAEAKPVESKPAEKPAERAETKPDAGHGANAKSDGKSAGDKPDSAKTSADKPADVKSEKKD